MKKQDLSLKNAFKSLLMIPVKIIMFLLWLGIIGGILALLFILLTMYEFLVLKIIGIGLAIYLLGIIGVKVYEVWHG
jgi:hypothetical protein